MQLTSGIWRTTTFRLSILFGVVYAIGIVLLLGLVYIQTAGYLTARVDRQITVEGESLARYGPAAILTSLEQESAHDRLNSFGLYSATGERIAGHTRLVPDELPLDGRPREIAASGGQAPSRALAMRLPWGEILIVERDTRQLEQLRRIILEALLWSGAIIAVLGLAAGIVLSARPLRRIGAMQTASDAIAAGDFSRRLPQDDSRDELDELARMVNRMMDEAERLVAQARTVGEGVAHELRTPLTRLRALLDHASEALETDDPRHRLLEQCVIEVDAVLARFRALLRIAAVETRGRRLGIGVASLTGIVEQMVELYEPVAADNSIALHLASAPDISVIADGELLLEAMSNLLDNAIKFTPSGGHVRIRVRRCHGGAAVEVEDNGPGIPEAERALVTKRFYRSQRVANVQGHGLGLSLVAAVADLHGFELSFHDAKPGTVVRLYCPGASAA